MPHYDSFEEAYPELIKTLLENGTRVTPRSGSSLGETLEICPFEFSIPADKPICRMKIRKLAYLFVFLEPVYLFTNQRETRIADALMTYAPNLKKLAYNEDREQFDGNYGDRIDIIGWNAGLRNEEAIAGDQMLRVYRLLKADPHSRRAVVTIHNPVWDIVDSDSKDIPCTLNLQFLIRQGKLDCFCTMRSNDVWYGTPHNVMMFTFLQRALASWLDVAIGTYHHRANSFHLYTAMEDKARAMMEEYTAYAVGEKSESDVFDTWVPKNIQYPYGHRSIVDTETDMNAIIRREHMYRTGEEVPKVYPFNGEYGTTLFELLREFWERKQAKKGRDFHDEFRHNKGTPLHDDPTDTTS